MAMSTVHRDNQIPLASCTRCGHDLGIRIPLHEVGTEPSITGKVYCTNTGCLHHSKGVELGDKLSRFEA